MVKARTSPMSESMVHFALQKQLALIAFLLYAARVTIPAHAGGERIAGNPVEKERHSLQDTVRANIGFNQCHAVPGSVDGLAGVCSIFFFWCQYALQEELSM